ncbi:MAG: protease modulator HflK [Phycisphaerales bacterium]|nr:MAG: protease modulator HflK [Phycisphaerales bacterium]
MAEEHNQENKDVQPVGAEISAGGELDAAGKSLSDALRISFVILKVIMIVLVAAFLASGFETVGSDERAIVLRFGKIRGVGEERLLEPGPHWILPYPIDEIVKIPVETTVNLSVDSFWYYERPEDVLSGQRRPVRPDKPLDPKIDGYCLTRNERTAEAVFTPAGTQLSANLAPAAADSDGSDYNIVHTKWQITYQIGDPERFFRNIYVRDITPGDDYFAVMTGDQGVKPLLENLFEDAVVSAMVNYTIDEAISSQSRIPENVKSLLQEKLDKVQSGIRVVSVQLTASEPPPQIRETFEASTRASQKSQTAITEARTYAENTLSQAAGPVAEDLFKALHDEAITEQDKEFLWSQVAGTARERIAEARAHRTQVVSTAKANADYLERLLPEYRQRPELVLQRIYFDAMEQIFSSADEKFVVQTNAGAKGKEIRVLLNRDPSLKPKASEQQATLPQQNE